MSQFLPQLSEPVEREPIRAVRGDDTAVEQSWVDGVWYHLFADDAE